MNCIAHMRTLPNNKQMRKVIKGSLNKHFGQREINAKLI